MNTSSKIVSLINQKIDHIQFMQLSGILAGIPFIKVVIDRENDYMIHFLNNAEYPLHAYYACDHILKEDQKTFLKNIDEFNEKTYHSDDRRFYFAIIQLIQLQQKKYYALETVEVDNMPLPMMKDLYQNVKKWLDPRYELLFKTANHFQELEVQKISPQELPRVFAFELYQNATYLVLNPGKTKGRVRVFKNEVEYQLARNTLSSYDIIVMNRVPDDIPRVSGIINGELTTPLSHTNVLASGWGAPNCVQIGIFEEIQNQKLDGQWVEYEVGNIGHATLTPISEPSELEKKPKWELQKVVLEKPDFSSDRILPLSEIRMTDTYRYGTKASNLGEMIALLEQPSEKCFGFYRMKRPPRENLIPHLCHFLKCEQNDDSIFQAAKNFFSENLKVPRGLAIPFSYQQEFLTSSPAIQQLLGKLKMALELEAKQIDTLCFEIQEMIKKTRISHKVKNEIDQSIAKVLPGVNRFVLRSSSNAEDLVNFSAAGIYESVNNVTTTEEIFEAIKTVWASLVSPRCVRLRQDAGISLDDSFMGVIIQEQVATDIGGVMVTKNPLVKTDFRNVYINVSPKSVVNIVDGSELPLQYLFNTVEGGGNTISLGDSKEELPKHYLDRMQQLAFVGKLLQGHFSPDYTFSQPVDMEWLMNHNTIYLLQVRPFAK